MSTRGLLAFKADGQIKAGYCHFDSYPGCLGVTVLKYLRAADRDQMRDQVLALQVVSEDSTPTLSEIAKLEQYADRRVSSRSLTEWYVLLHDTQGDPGKILEAGYMEDGFDFGYNSLFCEWGYVVDLDAGTFDVYKGFNTASTATGLWNDATKFRSGDYAAITHVVSYPLDDLPTGEAFIHELEGDNE